MILGAKTAKMFDKQRNCLGPCGLVIRKPAPKHQYVLSSIYLIREIRSHCSEHPHRYEPLFLAHLNIRKEIDHINPRFSRLIKEKNKGTDFHSSTTLE